MNFLKVIDIYGCYKKYTVFTVIYNTGCASRMEAKDKETIC